MEAILQGEVTMTQQVTAMLSSAGFASLYQTGWIRVTGTDRVRWLNGMLTNSIQALTPGQACYNFALNAQGRILGDMNVLLPPDESDALLIETDRGQIAPLIGHLDHFVIMDDVELEDVTARLHGISVVGPHAARVLEQLELTVPEEPLTLRAVTWKNGRVMVFHAHSPLVPRFEIWSDKANAESLVEVVSAAACRLSTKALEDLRVMEGTALYGLDIRNADKAHDLAQETAPEGTQSRALHFSKGCYLGQEIVERVRSRGSVHRAFSGFELTGALPEPGMMLESGGKAAGELTSVAAIPLESGMVQLGLGYVRRQTLQHGQPLKYPGGSAQPISLPYRAKRRSDI